MTRYSLLLLPLLVASFVGSALAQQPVYFLLYSHIDDHVHLNISQERLRRTVALAEKFSARNPAAHVSVVIEFSGAMAHAMEEGNGQTRSLDLVKGLTRRGVIEIGYRGADEPTPASRPKTGFRGAKSAEEWWSVRSKAAAQFLRQNRDPLTGAPLADGSGGLKEVQEIFGTVACVSDMTRDVGADTEFVHQLRRLNLSPLIFGLPEPSPLRNLHGYRDEARTFGALISPGTASAPELYWQDDFLRSSEISDRSVRVVHGYEGGALLKKLLQGLDRSKPHVVHVEIGGEQMYLTPEFAKGFLFPPVRFAYDHADRPALPREAVVPRSEVEEAYAREDSLMEWLMDDFFPANPGSRFVSGAALKKMTSGGFSSSVTLSDIKEATEDLLKRWGSDRLPPNYAQAGALYFSLADMFQLLSSALAEEYRTGKLPSEVMRASIYGPQEMTDDAGPNEGHVSGTSVARASAQIAPRLHSTSWEPSPANIVPSWIMVEGTRLNSAQFLRLMAQALLAPHLADKLRIQMCHMFSPAGEMFPRSGLRCDQGATWTFKPAILRLEATGARASQ